ncbi:hypothetical protein PAPHI01_2444 [Pancytospora philotis]|nr:hypothetical protein PAPHI01_2444 [Pancytospora philotis]
MGVSGHRRKVDRISRSKSKLRDPLEQSEASGNEDVQVVPAAATPRPGLHGQLCKLCACPEGRDVIGYLKDRIASLEALVRDLSLKIERNSGESPLENASSQLANENFCSGENFTTAGNGETTPQTINLAEILQLKNSTKAFRPDLAGSDLNNLERPNKKFKKTVNCSNFPPGRSNPTMDKPSEPIPGKGSVAQKAQTPVPKSTEGKRKARPVGTKEDFFSLVPIIPPEPTKFKVVKVQGVEKLGLQALKATLEAQLSLKRNQYNVICRKGEFAYLLVNSTLLTGGKEETANIMACPRVSACSLEELLACSDALLQGAQAITSCKKIPIGPLRIAAELIIKALAKEQIEKLTYLATKNESTDQLDQTNECGGTTPPTQLN